jgi:SAM-dependent methyltransferase
VEEDTYRSLYEREQTHWFCVTRREVIDQILAPFVPERSGRVLEVGSGTGGNIPLLESFGRLTCIEPSPLGRSLTAQRERPGLDLRDGFWPEHPGITPDEKFTVIAFLDVLEHLTDDVSALRAAVAQLAPSGRIVVTVPSYPWMWSNHDVALHHQRRYSKRTLLAVANAAGLRPLRVSYFNTLLFPAAALARLTFRVLRIPGSPGRSVPGTAVNRTLRAIFRSELPLLRRFNLPWGLSLILICEADRPNS